MQTIVFEIFSVGIHTHGVFKKMEGQPAQTVLLKIGQSVSAFFGTRISEYSVDLTYADALAVRGSGAEYYLT